MYILSSKSLTSNCSCKIDRLVEYMKPKSSRNRYIDYYLGGKLHDHNQVRMTVNSMI